MRTTLNPMVHKSDYLMLHRGSLTIQSVSAEAVPEGAPLDDSGSFPTDDSGNTPVHD